MKQDDDLGHSSVEFSRTQGIFSAIALGGSILLAIGVFVAGSELIQHSGSDTPLVFLITPLLFLPLILSCVQRSSSTLFSTSFYAAARSSRSPVRLFFTAWLTLAGYLSLGALLAYGAAVRANTALEKVLGLEVGQQLVIVLIVAIALVKQILTKSESWRSRTIVFWTCAIFLIILAGLATFEHYRGGVPTPKTEPLRHWLIAVSMLGSTLWIVDIILSYRGQLRHPVRTTLWSLICIFGGGCLLSALVSAEVLRNPVLLMQNWTAVLSWKESRLELLILIAGFLICFSGLLRVMMRSSRLLGTMMIDGELPAFKEKNNFLPFYSILFSALLASSAVFLSVTYLLVISGFAALLSIVLYLQPLIKKDLSRVTWLALPLHPLIPMISITLSIFLLWILPVTNLIFLAVWLIVGAIVYVTTARRKMLPALQQEQLFTTQKEVPSTDEYRVLVCLNNDEINESLIQLGSSIAAAKDGKLFVLRILESSELLPSDFQRKQGEVQWNEMREAIGRIALEGASATPVIRMAPDPISGYKATIHEFAPDFLLLEWPEESTERLRKNELQNLLQLTPRPIGILKGQITQKPEHLGVACGNNRNTLLALQLAESIASVNGISIEALRIFKKIESTDTATAAIHAALNKANITATPKILTFQEADIEDGVIKQTEGNDLLLVGVSMDPISGRPLPDGPSTEIAQRRTLPTLIVKSKEESGQFLVRRIVAQLTSRVTALTPKEKSELLAQLKVGLQARADFYLMVALAAAIAITGLIMNDGSVVLGAMLVSPLMSPIVGIACGIALGNLDLMRRSSTSTFKGMALVLGVGVLLTFLLPNVQPTDQILARTHPGIFDLLAALAAGAAGAYSLGRRSVAGALPGVAMSLSLEPPLATAGYGLSTSQFWITGGALLLFLTNLAAIVLSGVGVYLLLGMRPPKKESVYVVSKAVATIIVITLVLLIPLGFGTYGSLQKGHLKFQIESEFRDEALHERFQLLDLKIEEQENGFLIQPTILASETVTQEQIEKFRKSIEQKLGSHIQIEATILQTKRIESPILNNKE